MFKDKKDQLALTNQIYGKGLVLVLWCDDESIISRFKETCYRTLTREVNWFHQCDAKTYQMFEFWVGTPHMVKVREQCAEIAQKMSMELHEFVDESEIYNPG